MITNEDEGNDTKLDERYATFGAGQGQGQGTGTQDKRHAWMLRWTGLDLNGIARRFAWIWIWSFARLDWVVLLFGLRFCDFFLWDNVMAAAQGANWAMDKLVIATEWMSVKARGV